MNKKNPYYNGPVSDHFDGIYFFNPTDQTRRDVKDFIKWMRNRDKKKWPDHLALNTYDVPPNRSQELRVSFVNHVTFLIQINNVNILTDPLWSKRTSPVQFAGPKRLHNPGIRYADLPPIDYVLLSHTHYDHLDMPCMKKLKRDHNPRILTGLGVDKLLAKSGIKAEARDWYESYETSDIKIDFVPSFHWSNRTPFDNNFTLWGGFIIEAGNKKIYFAGDTGFDEGRPFQDIRERYGIVDLALLPIGAYEPRWFMKIAHMNPEEAIKSHKILDAKKSIAMHYGCFQLTDEGHDTPEKEFLRQMKIQNMNPDDFIILPPGEFVTL